jgi:hypothetical protein
MDVTQTWMLGVVSVMAAFFAIALVGYFLHRSRQH